MISIENEQEEKLIKSVRKMTPTQIETLLSFINTVVESDKIKMDTRKQFLDAVQEISKNVQSRGLTEAILDKILKGYAKGS